jgi:hypothetical protein
LIDDKAAAVPGTAPEPKLRNFAGTELISCEECHRSNPPTRANCLYCGAKLPIGEYVGPPQTAANPIVESNQMSTAGPGLLLVLTPGQDKAPAELSLEEIARVLQLPAKEVESVIRLKCPVPVLRTAAREDGMKLADKLRGLGIEVAILSEDLLELEVANQRPRSLKLSDDGLTSTLTNGEGTAIMWNELSLIVSGRLLVSRKEIEERKGRGRSKPVDNRELFSDEPVIDLYRRSEAVGWRISANSFDFSCLGENKAMTAFQNLTSLVDLIKTRALGIEFDDSYHELRTVLNNVWPIEPQTKAGEWRRSGVGKVNVSTITVIDNESQFNAYSRLRQRISLSQLKGEG